MARHDNPARRRLAAIILSMLTPLTPTQAQLAEPHLPDAIISPPKWLTNAPFDVNDYFKMPHPSENAAPLYLDAFYEFDDQMAICFPQAERTRSARAKRNKDRILNAFAAWRKDIQTDSIDRDEIDALVSALRSGLAKLDHAQSRPRCVFAKGLAFDSQLPHTPASVIVVRLLALRAARSLDRGEIDPAIADVRRILRLSRDIASRGTYLEHVYCSALDRIACKELVALILTHPRLQANHCDRLLAVLNDHARLRPDSLEIDVKAQYILCRGLIHSFEKQVSITADPNGVAIDKPMNRDQTIKLLASIVAAYRSDPNITIDFLLGNPKFQTDAKAQFDGIKSSIERSASTLETWASTMIGLERKPYSERVSITSKLYDHYKEVWKARDSAYWLFLVAIPPANVVQQFTLIPVYTHMGQTLVALKRWEVTHNKPPTSLEAACREAHLPAVPLDDFSGRPIKLIQLSGRPAIYAIGIDGIDDHGLKDSDFDSKLDGGDDILILPKPRPRPRR